MFVAIRTALFASLKRMKCYALTLTDGCQEAHLVRKKNFCPVSRNLFPWKTFWGPNYMVTNEMKKRSERRKHCALAVVRRSQKFSLSHRPHSRGRGTAKIKSAGEGQGPLPTNPVWWGSMHTISSYRGNRPTDIATNPHTYRTDYNTLRRS